MDKIADKGKDIFFKGFQNWEVEVNGHLLYF